MISLEELIIEDCSYLEVLPESLCQLKALRNLSLFGCLSLEKLPSDMGSLTNLQTLKISHTSVSYLPPSLGKFVRIQTLMGRLKCETIGWLKDFSNLHGPLYLYGLKNISNLMDVQCANLTSMCNLDHLMLSWNECYSRDIDDSELNVIIKRGQNMFLEDQSCFSVMVSFQPHPNLTKLQIEGYSGITFPEWIGSLCKLKYLKITNCYDLQFLEAESLPLELEELEIYGCNQLVSMPGIQKLNSLVKLSISNCLTLFSFMETSSELFMCAWEGSCGSSLLGLTNLTSLRSLQISNCIKLHAFTDELLPVEPCNVEVSNCPGLRQWCLRHGINEDSIDSPRS